MSARTTLGFSNDDWNNIRKFLIVVGALAAIGFVPNKYGKLAGVVLAISQF